MTGALSLSGVLPFILAAIVIIFGVLFCFFGYRLFKVILAIVGFIFGFVLTAGILYKFTNLTLISGLVGIVGGLIFAVLAFYLYFIGIFILGAYLGIVVWSVISSVTGIVLPFWVAIVLAVLLGVLALVFQKFMIIVTTAFIGAYLIVVTLVTVMKFDASVIPYVNAVGWLILGFLGIFVQYRLTAKKKLKESADIA